MTPRRLEQRNCAPQVERPIGGICHCPRELAGIYGREPRDRSHLRIAGQAFIARDAARRNFRECAHRCRVRGRAAAPAQRETSGPANLFRERTAR